MPEIVLNNNTKANVKIAIGPVGALIPIRLALVLIIPLLISSTRVRGFGNNQSIVL